MVSEHTRAAVLRSHAEPLSLEELPLPTQVEPGAAVVRITCATLCGTDVHLWSGAMTWPGMLPIVLGHEMVGVVEAVGDGTLDALGRTVEVGQRIGWSESTCGHCYGCSVLRQPVACSNRGYGFLQRADRPPYATGGLSEFCYVTPGAAKLILPDDVEDAWAAAAGCALKTVTRAVSNAGGIRVGSSVVVQGAGALGIFATALASMSGAATVVTIGAPDERLEVARAFGADVTLGLETPTEERVAAVMEATNGRGADLILDLAGGAGVGAEAVQMAAQGGRFVVVGSTGPAPATLPLGTIMGKELIVRGSLNGDIGDYHRAVELLPQLGKRFPLGRLFSPPVGLSGASDALAAMSKLHQIKAVVHPSQP